MLSLRRSDRGLIEGVYRFIVVSTKPQWVEAGSGDPVNKKKCLLAITKAQRSGSVRPLYGMNIFIFKAGAPLIELKASAPQGGSSSRRIM